MKETFPITPPPPPRPPFGRPLPDNKGPQLLTRQIYATEVRLIDGEENLVVSRAEAERMAEERGLDLVVMSLQSSPPVVKLTDYGKFKFETEKKAREAKKKQHVIDVKEIKFTVRIDKHDYQVKLGNAIKFLQGGDKVKATIRLKGREVQHSALAFDLARRFVVDLEAYGIQEGNTRMEGRSITIVLNPLKQVTPPPSASSKPAASTAEAETSQPSSAPPEA